MSQLGLPMSIFRLYTAVDADAEKQFFCLWRGDLVIYYLSILSIRKF
jgi:hypothetical protein